MPPDPDAADRQGGNDMPDPADTQKVEAYERVVAWTSHVSYIARIRACTRSLRMITVCAEGSRIISLVVGFGLRVAKRPQNERKSCVIGTWPTTGLI